MLPDTKSNRKLSFCIFCLLTENVFNKICRFLLVVSKEAITKELVCVSASSGTIFCSVWCITIFSLTCCGHVWNDREDYPYMFEPNLTILLSLRLQLFIAELSWTWSDRGLLQNFFLVPRSTVLLHHRIKVVNTAKCYDRQGPWRVFQRAWRPTAGGQAADWLRTALLMLTSQVLRYYRLIMKLQQGKLACGGSPRWR